MVECTVQANPSLALVKYWGKSDDHLKLPATPSVAVTVSELTTTTTVRAKREEATGAAATAEAPHLAITSLRIGEQTQPLAPLTPFSEFVAHYLQAPLTVAIESANSFPTAAGLASSASGGAALALSIFEAARRLGVVNAGQLDLVVLSRAARLISASASRSVYGGFTLLEAGADHAEQLHDENWWPELRIVVVPVSQATKKTSSREAMSITRRTSPYYQAWVADAPTLAAEARAALAARDIERLGHAMRRSYLRMFATMFAADPPIMYWLPRSIALQQCCVELRAAGVAAFETMDAGPQVKIITTAADLGAVLSAVQADSPAPIVATVGRGARVVDAAVGANVGGNAP